MAAQDQAGSTPLHRASQRGHLELARFLIEQGAIALWTPHECRTAGPGDVVMLPKVMPHTWRAYGEDMEPNRRYASRQFHQGAVFLVVGLGLFAYLLASGTPITLGQGI